MGRKTINIKASLEVSRGCYIRAAIELACCCRPSIVVGALVCLRSLRPSLLNKSIQTPSNFSKYIRRPAESRASPRTHYTNRKPRKPASPRRRSPTPATFLFVANIVSRYRLRAIAWTDVAVKVDGKLSQKVVLAAKECPSVKHFVLITALGTGKVGRRPYSRWPSKAVFVLRK